MTKMKKLSALTAAVLAFTMVGTIGASAETIDTQGGSASVELKGNVTRTSAIVDNPIQDVWNVTVDTTALVWDVTITEGGTRTITWDPETQTYSAVNSYTGESVVITNGETKNIAVTNKSNFDVYTRTTLSTEHESLDDLTTGSHYSVNEVFTVNDISQEDPVYRADTKNIAITLVQPGVINEHYDLPDGNEATTIATALIEFIKTGDTYTFNG